jgi:hypothetical protein
MTLRALSKGMNPERDPGGKGVTSFPWEAIAMTIYG